jgi:hypothetical protein
MMPHATRATQWWDDLNISVNWATNYSGVKTLFRSRNVRVAIAVIAAAGWFALSNHCALAAAVPGLTKAPMSCHGSPASNQPPANDKGSGMECCKVVRATLLMPAKDVALLDDLFVTPYKYFMTLFVLPDVSDQTSVLEWDTGPPAVLSFSEVVLQRSILAHAPPLVA